MLSTSMGRRTEWQQEAWRFTRTVSELGYFVRWRSNACAQVRFVASEIDPDTGLPTGSVDPDNEEGQQFVELVKQIAGGPLGQKALIKRAAACLTVPGELTICILQRPEGEKWFAVSQKQITTSTKPGSTIAIRLPDGTPDGIIHDVDPDNDAMFRVWNEDFEDPNQADSPIRACLEPLAEIERATKKIRNADLSRLLTNGLLMVPSEASLPDTQAPTAAGQTGTAPSPAQSRKIAGSLQRMIVQAAEHSNRDENSMAALVPIVVAAPGDHLGKVVHIEFSKEATKTAVDIRTDAIARVATGLDISQERLLGMGNNTNHWCKDESTEILIRGRGWLRHDEVQIGDFALTLNHQTGMSEWQPVLDIYRADVVDEPMLSMESSAHSSLSTAEHRWPVIKGNGAREWTTSRDGFRKRDRVPVAAPCASLPDTPKYSDSFVKLVAAYTADGSLLHYKSGTEYARIVKFDSAEIAELRSVLADVYGRSVSEHMHPTRTCTGTSFVLHADETAFLTAVAEGASKIVSRSFVESLTEAQLHLFIDAMIRLGDGGIFNGARMLFQVEPERLDAFELAATLAGYKVMRGRRNQQTGFGTSPLYWLRIGDTLKTFTPHSLRQEWVDYTGVVWCPTTTNRTWFARRNGHTYFTGNSAYLLADEDVKLHVNPVMEVLCQAIYTCTLANMLDKMGIDPSKYVLWFDASQLTKDPDLTDEAKDAYQHGVTTSKSLVKDLGLSADSMYDLTTDDGWAEWAKDRVSDDPARLPMLAQLIPELADYKFTPAGTPDPMTDQQFDDYGNPIDPESYNQNSDDTSTDVQEPDTETNDPTTPTYSTNTAAFSAVEDLMVNRALELAAKRRIHTSDRALHARLRHIPAHQRNRHLPAATPTEVAQHIKGWDDVLTPEFAAARGLNLDRLRTAVINRVTRELTTGRVNVHAANADTPALRRIGAS